MAKGQREKLPPIKEHPAFKTLVRDLKRQTPEQQDRFMDYLTEEQEAEETYSTKGERLHA